MKTEQQIQQRIDAVRRQIEHVRQLAYEAADDEINRSAFAATCSAEEKRLNAELAVLLWLDV